MQTGEENFYCCYLLRTLSPKVMNRAGNWYVGFSNDPSKRIRQHNGELTNGAKKTSFKRPWYVKSSNNMINQEIFNSFNNNVSQIQPLIIINSTKWKGDGGICIWIYLKDSSAAV